MKHLSPKTSRQSGSVLLAALLTAAIMGITLASYLVMTRAQHVSVHRSQVWNSTLAVSEAGIEDAMQMINKYSGDFNQLPYWTNNWVIAADNWTALGNDVYTVRRIVEVTPWGTNYYDAFITNKNNRPTIYSEGSVAWGYSYSSAAQPQFATIGLNTPAAAQRTKRTIVVTTTSDPLWAVAMAALQKIDFSGKNIATDSFDSMDPNFSGPGGAYPMGQLSKTKANGDVVTDFEIINSLEVGNAKIKGQVKTGPNGTISIGPNGSVGDRAWVEGGNRGIQPEHSANDMNVQFPSVSLPSSPGWYTPYCPNVITVDGIDYGQYILTDGDYFLMNLNTKLYIGSNVNCRILHYGDVKLTSGSDEIRVAPGAKVKFYMWGASFNIQGNGVVNMNAKAESFYYFGLPYNTAINFGGNASFTGAIYAPEAEFKLGGGGNETYDFIGASVSKSVKMNGHFNFHYDEALRNIGPGRGYVPTGWIEM